jgi:ADP-ribose pyrophosphatase YjhB (NUDIX family)
MPHCVKPPRRYGGRVTVRVDHWDDPAAPIPTRIVPGGSALVLDDEGRVLLQRRTDSGNWAMPGGVMEIGETLPDAVVRETREETGLEVALTGIVGTFTDPRHVIAYADGEVRQEFTIVFRARPIGGRLALSTESTEIGWFALDELADLPMHESTRRRFAFVQHGDGPYLG